MLRELKMYAVLPAKDLQRARSFYHDKLGFDPSAEMTGQLLYSTPSGMSFLIYETEYAGTARNTQMGWITTSFDSDCDQLRSSGVAFEEYDLPGLRTENGVAKLEGEKSAWFKDSEGNTLFLAELAKAQS